MEWLLILWLSTGTNFKSSAQLQFEHFATEQACVNAGLGAKVMVSQAWGDSNAKDPKYFQWACLKITELHR